jgi:putative Ca2+/H+ antiporter (TMEM165/GDT1 family)
MDILLALGCFALVFPAELPDKTFIAEVVMATRNRGFPVWAGGALALSLHAAIAVGAGRLIALLPAHTVDIVVAAALAGGAGWLLFVPERHEEERGETLAAERSWHHVAATAFGVVFLAEWGDPTQILMVDLEARYHQPLSVFVGSALALVAVAALAVTVGRNVIRYVPLVWVRRAAGLLLAGLAIASAVAAAGG